jgi:hypothetical protein
LSLKNDMNFTIELYIILHFILINIWNDKVIVSSHTQVEKSEFKFWSWHSTYCQLNYDILTSLFIDFKCLSYCIAFPFFLSNSSLSF